MLLQVNNIFRQEKKHFCICMRFFGVKKRLYFCKIYVFIDRKQYLHTVFACGYANVKPHNVFATAAYLAEYL